MDYNVREQQNAVIIPLEGNIMGGPDGTKLHETLHNLKEQGKANVVVDLSNAKFMNSSGLGMLISGLTTMRNSGGDLRLANVADKIQSLLVVTKLNTVFKTYDSVDAAVVSYNEEPARAQR